MKKSKMLLAKLVLLGFGSLLVVCTIHADRAVGLPYLTAAKASADPSEDGSGADAVLQEQYAAAQALLDAKEYEKAFHAFQALGEFSDSRAMASKSQKKWKATRYQQAISLFNEKQYAEAKEIFQSLDDYQKSRSYADDCTWRINRIEYQRAEELYDAGDYENAKKLFESFGNWRDSPERAQAAADMIRAQEQAQAELILYEKALALKKAGDLEQARDTLILAGDCKDSTDQLYSIIDLLALRAVYEQAEDSFSCGAYENAFHLFKALGEYENSPEKAILSQKAWQASVYEDAAALQDQNPSRSYLLFLFLGDYHNSASLAEQLRGIITDQAIYAAADAFAQDGGYAQAKLGFEAVSPYLDSRERVERLNHSIQQENDFQQALFLRAIGDEEQANAIFEALGDYRNASEMVAPLTPRFSAKQLRDDQTSAKSSVFVAPDGTKHRYQIFKGVHTWVEARAFCEVLGGHLATLTTAEENAFVHRFMLESGYLTAYFGLSDEKREGDWVWVTGEPFDYSNWHIGEPSRCARERYGMYFYKHTDGTWNDSHFYEHVEVDPGCSFICEWDE